MTAIQQLLHLTLETEGLLRILSERNDSDAKSLLKDKIKQIDELMTRLDEDECAVEAPVIGETVKKEEEEVRPVEVTETEETVAVEETVAEDIPVTVINRVADCPKPAAVQSRPPVNLMKVFTLNDKFRFRRELFHGNENDFIDTLNLLSEMNSFKEAQEYLLGDMAWDKDDENVTYFLSILSENMPA